jgi:hypothetical protein
MELDKNNKSTPMTEEGKGAHDSHEEGSHRSNGNEELRWSGYLIMIIAIRSKLDHQIRRSFSYLLIYDQ